MEDQDMEQRTGSPRTSPDAKTDITATKARQGVTGHGVRYVLFFSLAGVIAVFAVLLLLNLG
jgi:hypothetical protein